MLRAAPWQIEADLQRFYGRRIGEFWRTVSPRQTGEMTPRELVALVKELPDDSRYKRVAHTAWSLQERLAAKIVNAVQSSRAEYLHVNGGELRWTPVEPPELPHERKAREAAEAEKQHQNVLGPKVFEAMLRGELKMSDIDPSRPIEEALQGVA
ncbi:hypothetical protein B7C42_01650 [Nocardia cerradoensis]|uniref:Uncharacterized protein n=1 Tax=Nocardia cerradoensis TaxID=85688 RepID=A0A231HD28_9NOCA|nr:hypothetical protein [Nocardia cerradoensis]OXR46675.1 hypothetical protein B7C42_01650 [Nocardia cerradoensis]